jgi:hypothetical protein
MKRCVRECSEWSVMRLFTRFSPGTSMPCRTASICNESVRSTTCCRTKLDNPAVCRQMSKQTSSSRSSRPLVSDHLCCYVCWLLVQASRHWLHALILLVAVQLSVAAAGCARRFQSAARQLNTPAQCVGAQHIYSKPSMRCCW